MPLDPTEYFELTMDGLREVARFAAQGAREALDLLEAVERDVIRPGRAIAAAQECEGGARQTNLQRVTAVGAHRAASGVMNPAARHAAFADGDAALAAYLHPYVRADQLGQILRADAHAAHGLRVIGWEQAPSCVPLRGC